MAKYSNVSAKRWATPRDLAEQAEALMRRQGFDAAQVDASDRSMTELNVAHNTPSLLRSTEQRKLQLVGIVDGRRAATELTPLDAAGLREAVAELHAEARAAPQDTAHAVSHGQQLRLEQGPLDVDADRLVGQLADAVSGLLAFRAAQTPTTMVLEGAASHVQTLTHTLTTGGSDLAARLGWYELSVMAGACEGGRSSSFNYLDGATHDLADRPAEDHFGLAAMLRDLTRQTAPLPLDGKFTGDVVLTPPALASVLDWLFAQVGDTHLIAGSSILRDRVGEAVAAPALHLRSRFDAPGVVAVSADAFSTPPVELLRAGRLMTLLPSLYGSRKTGLPHRPVAPSGWALDAGDAPLQAMLAGVTRGALVGRLSMGAPAANGDFSGVIKNSFAIDDGVVGQALSETMISGNIGQMLRDVVAVSRERTDTGATCLPWLHVRGLHFS